MRPADMKKHIALAILAVLVGAAGAQPAPSVPMQPPVPAAPALPPVGQPAAVPAIAPQAIQSMGQKVGGIAIGREQVIGQGADSLKDLEALQRQAYFLDLRAKMKEINTALNANKEVAPAMPAASVMPAVPPVLPSLPAALPAEQGVEPPPVIDEQPTARVVSAIVTAGRARADVTTGASVITVKEGDELGDGWRVASIKSTGVRAEKVVTRKRFDPDFVATVTKKVGKKPSRPVVAPMVEYEKTLSFLLKPADGFSPVAPVQAAAQAPAPVVPPLPQGVRPLDSTSVPPALPLGTGLMPPIAAGLPGSTIR